MHADEHLLGPVLSVCAAAPSRCLQDLCAPGFTGPLCGTCQDSRSSADGRRYGWRWGSCRTCGPVAGAVFAFIVARLADAFFLVCLVLGSAYLGHLALRERRGVATKGAGTGGPGWGMQCSFASS